MKIRLFIAFLLSMDQSVKHPSSNFYELLIQFADECISVYEARIGYHRNIF